MKRHCGTAVLLIAAIAACAFGQTEVGLKMGLNASRFAFAASPEDSWSSRWTSCFGGFASFATRKRLSSQIEVCYVRKGATATGAYAGSEVIIRERLAYIEGLALMNLRIWSRNRISVDAQAGIFGASRVGAKTLTTFQGETAEEDIRSEIRSLDGGIAAGLEGRWRAWRLDVRATIGLADLRADRGIGSSVKNRSFSLTIGYGFRLVKFASGAAH